MILDLADEGWSLDAQEGAECDAGGVHDAFGLGGELVILIAENSILRFKLFVVRAVLLFRLLDFSP